MNEAFFDQQPNRLAELWPNAAEWTGCVRVIDLPNDQAQAMLRLNANTMNQSVFCYLEAPGAATEP